MQYSREHNNVPVEGYAGDSIKLIIDAKGVTYYFRLWREIDESSSSKLSSELITNEEAVEKGLDALKPFR